VFAAASAAGVGALVYASSVGAYSPGPGRRVDESWPTHSVPTAAYGREKAYVERLLDTFEARHPDIRVVRLRPAFIFQRQAASEQRRIFAGPLLPAELRFQALHANHVAAAYRLAVVGDGRGAYNVAADPVIDAASIGAVLGSSVVPVPGPLARVGLTAAWRLHLVPAEPERLRWRPTWPSPDRPSPREARSRPARPQGERCPHDPGRALIGARPEMASQDDGPSTWAGWSSGAEGGQPATRSPSRPLLSNTRGRRPSNL
jgi:UDP-glucose 4-epimerase